MKGKSKEMLEQTFFFVLANIRNGQRRHFLFKAHPLVAQDKMNKQSSLILWEVLTGDIISCHVASEQQIEHEEEG